MVKSAKRAPARKPVKARGALPTPKSTPPRSRMSWYTRPGYQLVAMVVLIALVGTAIKVGSDWMRTRKETRTHTQAVRQFDRKYGVLKASMGEMSSDFSTATADFSSGKMSKEDFQKKTDDWLKILRKTDSELREPTVPQSLPELEEARAMLVGGNLVYIDAVKSFAMAAGAADTGIRDQAIQQGHNLAAHGASVVGTGERVVDRLKRRFGLQKQDDASPAGPPAIQLPSEEAPPAGAADPTGQTMPGLQGQPGQPGLQGQPPGAPGQSVPVQPAP